MSLTEVRLEADDRDLECGLVLSLEESVAVEDTRGRIGITARMFWRLE